MRGFEVLASVLSQLTNMENPCHGRKCRFTLGLVKQEIKYRVYRVRKGEMILYKDL